MSIANNRVVMSDVTVGASSWWWSFTCWTSPTSITGSSRFVITNNSITVTDWVESGYLRWGVMHSWNYPLTITDNSSLVISNIRVVGLNLRVSGFHWVGVFMDLPKTPNTVSTSSTLSMSNIDVDLTNVVASDNIEWRGLDLKFTSATISSSSSISNNSMSLVNVNAREGIWWYGLTALGSPLAITTGSNLTVSTNIMTASTVIGPVTARQVSMSGSGVRELGTSNGSVCPRHSSCSDADSKGVYLCGNDMSGGSANTQELTFECTLPTTTSSPWSPSNQDNSQGSSSSSGLGTSALVAVIVSVVVGFAILVVVTVVVSVFCCCKKRSTLPDAPQQSPEHRVVELTPTTTYQQQHLEYSSTPYTTATNNAQPVLGVPMEEMPVADNKGGREVPPPYGGGGCYL